MSKSEDKRKLDPAITKDLQELGQTLGQHIEDNVLFSLWLYDLRNKESARHYFISSVEREDVLRQTALWVAMQLDSVEHFSFDKSEVKAEDVDLIKQVANWQADILPKVSVKLPPPAGSPPVPNQSRRRPP